MATNNKKPTKTWLTSKKMQNDCFEIQTSSDICTVPKRVSNFTQMYNCLGTKKYTNGDKGGMDWHPVQKGGEGANLPSCFKLLKLE